MRTLENFDFSFQPSLCPQYIKELGNLSFLEKAENILLLGPPGTGKSHLAVAIGVKACMAKKRVLSFLVDDLLDQLVAAKVSGTLPKKLAELSRLDLILCDELGYNSIDKERANLFFHLVAKRYERGSIILTSNKTFDEWGNIFCGDDVVATGTPGQTPASVWVPRTRVPGQTQRILPWYRAPARTPLLWEDYPSTSMNT